MYHCVLVNHCMIDLITAIRCTFGWCFLKILKVKSSQVYIVVLLDNVFEILKKEIMVTFWILSDLIISDQKLQIVKVKKDDEVLLQGM